MALDLPISHVNEDLFNSPIVFSKQIYLLLFSENVSEMCIIEVSEVFTYIILAFAVSALEFFLHFQAVHCTHTAFAVASRETCVDQMIFQP